MGLRISCAPSPLLTVGNLPGCDYSRRLGFRFAKEKIANVDGVSWIKTQLIERPEQLPLDGLGLD
ncbi:MAG: hypothetical protein KDA80_14570, partial [Planctomycetaceae bacterium]|nr:hypothetical protein [Planctomycetaceae bacterium]